MFPSSNPSTRSTEVLPPRHLKTMVDVCRWRADDTAESKSFGFLVNGTEEVAWTYADLDRKARSIAVALTSSGRSYNTGQRVLIVLQPGLEYIASLLGCMYAGHIAVPVYPPDMFRIRTTLPRLQAIVDDSDAKWLISSRDIMGETVGPMWTLSGACPLLIEDVDDSSANDWIPRSPRPSDICLLQYTSGSTGSPRGVALTHANLIANLDQSFEAFDVDNAVCVFWLPPYHDMGLIGGIFLPLYGGRLAYHMSPLAFVQQPKRWLAAIDKYKATSSASPNFGYELCTRKIDLDECQGFDLSSWRLAIVGAEPVRAATLDRFIRKFGPLGFDGSAFTPAYGMAEATLAISGQRNDQQPLVCNFEAEGLRATPAIAKPLSKSILAFENLAKSSTNNDVLKDAGKDHDNSGGITLVGCGTLMKELKVKIVDPENRKELPQGTVGEIWVSGPNVGQYYWNNIDSSSDIFQARLASGETHAYLRTGDMGFLHAGELFISGRRKELIILGGKNYFPQDIEPAVQATHSALKVDAGIAFSIEVDNEEQLVVVQEVLRPQKYDLDEIIHGILLTLARDFQLTPHSIVLVSASSLPKTSSGKLRRLECRRMYEEGELIVQQVWNRGSVNSDRDSIEHQESPHAPALLDSHSIDVTETVADIWRDVLGVDQVRPTDHFLDLGGQSLTATELLVQIHKTYHIEFGFDTLLRFPTLQQFSEAVSGALQNRTGIPKQPLPARQDKINGSLELPLTPTQRRFWVADQLGQRGAFLHVGFSLDIDGTIDRGRLQTAVNAAVRQHPALRAAFHDNEGRPFQQIQPSVWCDIASADISQYSAVQRQDELQKLQRELASTPFDVSQPPLMRWTLIKVTSQLSQIFVVAHHMVCDASSLQILLAEVADYYNAPDKSISEHGDDRYIDLLYSIDRNDQCVQESSDIAKTEASGLVYWKNRLSNANFNFQFPTPDRTAELKLSQSSNGVEEASYVLTQTLSDVVKSGIEQLARQQKVTPFAVYLTAWQSVVAKYSGAPDFLIGIPVANRDLEVSGASVGCFINTVAVRSINSNSATLPANQSVNSRNCSCISPKQEPSLTPPPSSEDRLRTYSPHATADVISESNEHGIHIEVVYSADQPALKRANQQHHCFCENVRFRDRLASYWPQLVADIQHCATPFEDILGEIPAARTASGMPLVQNLFLFQPPVDLRLSFGDAKAVKLTSDYTCLSAFDTTAIVEDINNRITLKLATAPRRVCPDVAKRILAAWQSVLESIAANPDISASRLPVPPKAERRQLLHTWNATNRSLPQDSSFLDRFRSVVQKNGDAIAVIDDSKDITFRQLDSNSNRLATYLKQHGVGPGTLVGVSLNRSSTILEVILAIWKAGGAYVPLDPSYPANRLKSIVDQCTPGCIITDSSCAQIDYATGSQTIAIHEHTDAILQCSNTEIASSLTASDLAYIIFTSGSTGQPKGVMIEHGSVMNFLHSFARTPGMQPGQVCLALTTISFDISVLELLLPLYVGGTIRIPRTRLADSPDSIAALIDDTQVDLIQGTPSSFQVLLASGWRPQKSHKVLCGGEPLSADLARRLTANAAELWNVYGPTETTIWSTIQRITPDCQDPLPIGKPIDNTQILIVDDSYQVQPIGVPGQLLIGGSGLARGYWNQPDLTSNKFITLDMDEIDPPAGYSSQNGLSKASRQKRYYQTGDIAKWRSDGTLELLGRQDRQVKLRGFRIELGEIETTLVSHPSIASAAVLFQTDSATGGTLSAYCVLDANQSATVETLHRFLADRLPHYMLPGDLLIVDALPQTPAGKIDYQSLASQNNSQFLSRQYTQENNCIAPRDTLEFELQTIWENVLGRSPVGVTDNFFDLGGHSLMAAQLFARIRSRYAVNIPIRDFYHNPTISDVALRLRNAGAGQVDVNNDNIGNLLDLLEGISDEEAIARLQPPATLE